MLIREIGFLMSTEQRKWHIAFDMRVLPCVADAGSCKYHHYASKEIAEAQAKLQRIGEQMSKTVAKAQAGRRAALIESQTDSILSNAKLTKSLPPQIYAFTIDKLQDQLFATKIGDTTRTVNVRLDEWKAKGGIYENLKLLFQIDAKFINNDGKPVYVRDYNFHKYLEHKGFRKLVKLLSDYPDLQDKHLSQEFFVGYQNRVEEITKQLLEDALQDQKDWYGKPQSPYQYYDEVRGKLNIESHYLPVDSFDYRPFQHRVIKQASEYLTTDTGELNKQFLLTAPTRSGKSFMAASIALESFEKTGKEHSCAVVVSGFAEITDEWKRSVEQHYKFCSPHYGREETNECRTTPCSCSPKPLAFLEAKDLKANSNAVRDAYANGNKNVLVFLTLQDLAHSNDVKTSEGGVYEYLGQEGSVDLLIGDEAHFAIFSRGKYAESITTREDDANLDENVLSDKELEKAEQILTQTGLQNPTLGKLFVTATPFNNVPLGSKFINGFNAAIITETEIHKELEKWYKDYPEDDESNNPSFGIPEKRTFGMDLGMPANEFFSATKNGFKHKEKVQEFIEGFFSPTANKIPNFMGNKDFLDAGLGRHIISSLPRKNSCDAMETELNNFLKKNGLDDEYVVLNIASNKPKLDKKYPTRMSVGEIKTEIDQLAAAGKKTITLTVNRMCTGITQDKWDTALSLRTLSSAQQTLQFFGRVGSITD